ncbi:hypothetical protein DVH05_004218 [Phytophthora capsici]|nr:hypothetical protein DVH05_004218 [Phytophthora capsici]
MEEMNFLFTHTSYASECSSIIVENGYGMGNPYHYWSDSEDDDYYSDCGYHDKKRKRRKEIKRRIKEQYLHNSRGMALPAKWQRELESRVAASQTS